MPYQPYYTVRPPRNPKSLAVSGVYGLPHTPIVPVTASAPAPAPPSAPIVTGSTLSFAGSGWTSYAFTNTGASGSIQVFTNTTIDFLVVGGGGGGAYCGGGGGAGGFRETLSSTLSTGTYNVVVGRGGFAGTYNGGSPVDATNGLNSSFNGVTAFGGGAGGQVGRAGLAGGSGGGDGFGTTSGTNVGVAGQGNAGVLVQEVLCSLRVVVEVRVFQETLLPLRKVVMVLPLPSLMGLPLHSAVVVVVRVVRLEVQHQVAQVVEAMVKVRVVVLPQPRGRQTQVVVEVVVPTLSTTVVMEGMES